MSRSEHRGRSLRDQNRRRFLQGTTAGLVGAALDGGPDPAGPPASFRWPGDDDVQPVGPLPAEVTRTWPGPAYWANRLQDWRLHRGRIECLAGGPADAVRTVAVLTRELVAGAASASLSVRVTRLEGGDGFGGFLIGAGGGRLDYRAAALVQKASGLGGGLLCTYEADGRVRFREHTDEADPLAFAELPGDPAGPGRAPAVDREVLLRLDILPRDGRFDLHLAAWDPEDETLLAGSVRRAVAESEILGGLALASSPSPGRKGARFAFRDLRGGGAKLAVHPERALGPILGALYSLNGRVLKLNAQFLPVGDQEPQAARFQYRTHGGTWCDGPIATLGPGYTALFRLEEWDATRDWEYHVVYPLEGPPLDAYQGTIRRDPVDKESLTIGLFSCVTAGARTLEGGSGRPEIPGEEFLGRYTTKNLYFPHRELTENAGRHEPDLLVFTGDQLYEGSPTRKEAGRSPTLDYLYKWALWVWSFRDMTRHTPAIVLVDDHDVYQGNIWGAGGRPAPGGIIERGGYACAAAWVNLVQRTQCGHDPDPDDPTPIEQGIGVYYGAFRYGVVGFAILEDRKFKGPAPGASDLHPAEADRELLGARQEAFLANWAKDKDGVVAKVCLTQTSFACIFTNAQGRPQRDPDSNGAPKPARDRAIRLLREAGALVLAGDQHLASLVRHGLEGHGDAVVQFAGPAGGTMFQRWFEPAAPLPNGRGTPETGDFVDGFGNKVRVLAVANPKVSQRVFKAHHRGRGNNLGDRALKREGYGIVRVDRARRQFIIECWPWDTDPRAPEAEQFAGWPYHLPFDETAGQRRRPG